MTSLLHLLAGVGRTSRHLLDDIWVLLGVLLMVLIHLHHGRRQEADIDDLTGLHVGDRTRSISTASKRLVLLLAALWLLTDEGMDKGVEL